MTTIGLIQMECGGHAQANLQHALSLIDKAATRSVNIVCLPELFLSTYFCQKKDDVGAFKSAVGIPNETTALLSQAALKHGIVLVGGSLFEKGADGKFYNTATVFGPDGSLLGTYRKTHIPEDFRYHEQHYFSPGDTGVRVFQTPFGRIAPLICYDQWFPEAARIATLNGAEIIVYPTAIGNFTDEDPEEGNWQDAWEGVQRGHAIANSVCVAAVNRVGTEDCLSFFGGSFICDDFGTVLARGGKDEEIALATIDLSRIEKTREGWGFFRNRRPGEYGKITEGFDTPGCVTLSSPSLSEGVSKRNSQATQPDT